VHSISTIKDVPIGATLWKDGHVGIYVGDGKYIAEDGSVYGCREAKLPYVFTHWLIMSYLDYSIVKPVPVPPPAPEVKLIKEIDVSRNGKIVKMESVNIDGFNWVKLRDIASEDDGIFVGYDSSKNLPILNTK
jgi:hypothetical protein